MKKDNSKKRARTNAILTAICALVVSIALVFLSRLAHESAKRAAVTATQPGATATAPASAPAQTPSSDSPANGRKPVNQRAAVTERLAGLLLLFGLMALGLAVVCAGWIVYDIRRSRPAWMTQTKYPVMEKRRKAKK